MENNFIKLNLTEDERNKYTNKLDEVIEEYSKIIPDYDKKYSIAAEAMIVDDVTNTDIVFVDVFKQIVQCEDSEIMKFRNVFNHHYYVAMCIITPYKRMELDRLEFEKLRTSSDDLLSRYGGSIENGK